jgi:hypothetical protein
MVLTIMKASFLSLAVAATALLGAAPVPLDGAPPARSAVVTCAGGAALYLWANREIPYRTTDRVPVGSEIRIVAGPFSPDRVGVYYETNVPTLHREGDGPTYWVSDACVTLTN